MLSSAGGIGVTFETWLSFYTSQVIKQEEENLSESLTAASSTSFLW